ncbi:hypothetical protein LB823_19210 [Tsukamurella sp. M9C]|uniref:hypothetical protein n=1 Tax=Tsukamurella sp. M9C TaxID=2877520 RepID=UPI001CCE7AA0|nr:hypothetical protein [Tsukamurella sp. M9C]MCA0158332.1 hypothetical protein [Tsukamurella sp. M9C]
MLVEFLKYGVGWILAVTAIAASGYYFVYGKRRKKVEVDVQARGLVLASAKDHGELSVGFNGKAVVNPYVIDFSVRNVGHKDISTKDFDADGSLSFDVGAEIVASLLASGGVDGDRVAAGEGEKQIRVTPGKIATGQAFRARVLVDGEPSIAMAQNPLIDTDLVLAEVQRAKQRKNEKRLLICAGSVSLAIAATVIVLMAFKEEFHIEVSGDGWNKGSITSPVWAVVLQWAFYVIVPGLSLVPLGLAFRKQARKRTDSDDGDVAEVSIAGV